MSELNPQQKTQLALAVVELASKYQETKPELREVLATATKHIAELFKETKILKVK